MATVLGRTQHSSLLATSFTVPLTLTLAPRSSATSSPFIFSTSLPSPHHPQCTQRRHATIIRRPKRPYTFTQLVTLSDGSTYLHRTSSPTPIHRSTKDQRNSPLWNPSSSRLRSVEADAAGRLRAFRARFGRGWDAAEGTAATVVQEAEEGEREGLKALSGREDADPEQRGVRGDQQDANPPIPDQSQGDESFLDLIAGFKRDETVERGMQSRREKKGGPVPGGKKKK